MRTAPPAASIAAIGAAARMPGGVWARRRLAATASADSAVPSWKVAPARRSKV
jgi:hypothetical protein